MADPPLLCTAETYAALKLKSGRPAPTGLSGLLSAATGAIRAHCGWHVAPLLTQTVTVDGSGSRLLSLPTTHVVAVLGVTEDGYTWSEDDLSTLEWSGAGYLLKRSGRWSRRLRGVTVILQHGFDDVPEVTALAADIVARAVASPSGFIREQGGQVATAATQVAPNAAGGVHLMAHERDLLAPYRLGVRA